MHCNPIITKRKPLILYSHNFLSAFIRYHYFILFYAVDKSSIFNKCVMICYAATALYFDAHGAVHNIQGGPKK